MGESTKFMKQVPEELNEFYNSLENLNSLSTWNIQKELKPAPKIKGEWKEKIIVERKLLNYNLNKGELITNVQVTDTKGQVVSIRIDKNELDYLKIRLDKTENTWLKSRYSHLLWQETKHNKYAEIAIINYIQTVNKIKANEARELPIILSAILFIGHRNS